MTDTEYTLSKIAAAPYNTDLSLLNQVCSGAMSLDRVQAHPLIEIHRPTLIEWPRVAATLYTVEIHDAVNTRRAAINYN